MFGLPRFSAVIHPTAVRARCCLTFFFDCILFRLSSIQVPSWPADLLLDFFFGCAHFPAITHPTADPSPVLLDFIFGCLVFRRSPIPGTVPETGAADFEMITHPRLLLDLWLSRFPAVTHSTADRARCCLTLFFDCLLYRWSPIHVPIRPGAAGLHLRLSRFPPVTHPTADRARCCLTFFFDCLLSSSGGHPSKCRPGTVLLDFFFGCPVFRWTHSTADRARCCY